eukprot:SAG31_NODE_22485_length_524_cov_1.334118_1_plen_68_part_10
MAVIRYSFAEGQKGAQYHTVHVRARIFIAIRVKTNLKPTDAYAFALVFICNCIWPASNALDSIAVMVR